MVLLWWETDGSVSVVGDGRWCYCGGRRTVVLLWWETDGSVIVVGDGR